MENSYRSRSDCGGRVGRICPFTCGFATNQAHRRVVYEVVKRTDGVRPAAHACAHDVGQRTFLFLHLLLNFLRDYRLKIAHNRGERMRAHHRTQAVVCVADAACPFAKCLVNGIFKRCRAAAYRANFGSQQAHFIHVQRLALGVFLAHEHNALHAEQRCGRCGGNAVLTCASFCNQARFPHFFRKESLPKHVVYFVRACVV